MRIGRYVMVTFAALIMCRIAVPAEFAAGEGGHEKDSRDEVRTIEYGGRDRSYVVHLPPGFDAGEKVPVVIMLHGGGANAEHAMKTTGWREKADEENFIVIFPNGAGWSGNSMLTWNAGRCCAYSKDHDIDDAGFVSKIIDLAVEEIGVDASRVYATGFSNGGMMVHALGCEISEKLAAIAPVGGSLEAVDCKPEQPLGVIILHGTDDQNVPYEGGRGKKALVKLEKRPVMFAAEFWKQHDGCAADPVVEENGDVVQKVELYKIIGGTHSWPGGKKLFFVEDDPVDFISATDVIWDFFEEHAKNSDTTGGE